MNILWKTPGGGVALTFLSEGVAEDEAALLKERGGVPFDWEAVAFNYEPPGDFFQSPYLWDGQSALLRKDIDLAKALSWGRIKAERDRRKAGGVKVGDKWFHSDDGSRLQQMGLVMMGANIPAGLQWKTPDGSFITMTASLAQQIFTAQVTSDQTIFAHAEALRVAMEASADPEAFDYLAGWPKIYGEA